MAAAVSVLVPWRPDDAERDRAWEYVRAWWGEHHPGWQVVTGGCPDGPWRKALAVADALKQADGEVLVVADADVVSFGIAAAVEQVSAGRAPWAIPHGLVYRLTAEATQLVYDGDPLQPDQAPADLSRPPYRGVEGGGLVVLPRTTYERAPLDPRFAVWGQDDEAWALALTTLAGPAWRGSAPLRHLWHEPAPRQTQRIGNRAGWALYGRYKQAARQGHQSMDLLVAQYRGVTWDEETMDILGPGWDDTPAGRIGDSPVKFVSEKYADLHIPTIGVRFRDGKAEVSTRGAIAYLRSPWMRKRGVRLASEVEESNPAPAATSSGAESNSASRDGVAQLGGGWWNVVVDGHVVDKVRGKAAAQRRLQALASGAA